MQAEAAACVQHGHKRAGILQVLYEGFGYDSKPRVCWPRANSALTHSVLAIQQKL